MHQPSIRDFASESVPTSSATTGSAPLTDLNHSGLATSFGIDKQGWELAFWRSEMLRRFKTDLLGNLGHELRSPLSSQLGSLDLVLSGLCDSQAEIQEFISAARQSAQAHLQLIAECIALSRYESPVLPLSAHATSLAPMLKRVENLLDPIARDRGLRLEWGTSHGEVLADPHGCEQILLGLGIWSLGQLVHGTLSLNVTETKAALERGHTESDCLSFIFTTSGKLRQESNDRDALYWHVPLMVLEAMGGQLLRSDDSDRQQSIEVQLPALSTT